MRALFQCAYCGNKWADYFYHGSEMPRCPKCGSLATGADELSEADSDVFGYKKDKKKP
jgi:hypothetical protein